MGRGGVKKQLINKIKNKGKETSEELSQQMKSSNFWTEVFRTLSLVGFYYVASIGLTFYQSWLLKVVSFVFEMALLILNPLEIAIPTDDCPGPLHHEVCGCCCLQDRIHTLHRHRQGQSRWDDTVDTNSVCHKIIIM